MRIYIAQLNFTIGALEKNADKIIAAIHDAKSKQAELVVFSELAICGYPPEDLLLLPHFVEEIEKQLQRIAKETIGILAIVGTVRRNPSTFGKSLCNSAAILENGHVVGYQDKTLLPTYDVFDECRYFEPAQDTCIWELRGQRIAITICEDIWEHSEQITYTTYQKDPIEMLREDDPDFVINISASPYSANKMQARLTTCQKTALSMQCPLIYCNQIGGNDSLIFDGGSLYMDEKGTLLAHAKKFQEDFLFIDLTKTYPKCSLEDDISSLYQALVLGVHDYFYKLGFTKACLGISGGIDSALVASIAVEALGKDNVLGLIMPSRYSSEGSVTDAELLAKNLGMRCETVPIEKPFQSYLDLLEPFFEGKPHDLTEENLQARVRGMTLMAFSNKLGYIVLSTGNKSEMAMGYATLYGDMCGGLAVISDVTKEQVYALSRYVNRDKEIIPKNTLEKAPSAELRPNQKDSDTLPDYNIIDNVLREYVEEHTSPEDIIKKFNYDPELVHKLIQKIHRSEYKRRQSPPGLRVSHKSFTVGRRFPIVEGWV